MNLKLSKEKLAAIGIILFLILLLAGLYFFVLYPKLEMLEQKENELNMQKQLLSTIESQMTKSNQTTFASATTLQQLVPVKPLAEQLLLEIEKAEVVSGSFVASMSFADGGEVTPEEEPVEEAELESETEGESGTQTDSPAGAFPSFPNGIQKVTVTMSIESPSYFELETFIETLENSKRIISVDSIDFTANAEIIKNEPVDQSLSYEVMISAFYMPSLTDLIDQLPRLESPAPANKKNPFSNFGEVSTSMRNPVSPIPKINSPIKSEDDVIHTVKLGDTLFDIAMQYYQSHEGIQKIREANGITGHLIHIGQKLLIPLEKGNQTVQG